jgi:hypothetical protein
MTLERNPSSLKSNKKRARTATVQKGSFLKPREAVVRARFLMI